MLEQLARSPGGTLPQSRAAAQRFPCHGEQLVLFPSCSFKVGLLATNSMSFVLFCFLPENALVSPSFLKDLFSLGIAFWVASSFLSALKKDCATSFRLLWSSVRNTLLFELIFTLSQCVRSLAAFKISVVFSFQKFDPDVSWNGFLCCSFLSV